MMRMLCCAAVAAVGSVSLAALPTDDSEALHRELARLCPPRPETAAKFEPGTYPAATKTYRACAEAAYAYMMSLKGMTTLVETGWPEQRYQHNAYPSKTHAAHIQAMLAYAQLQPASRDRALRFARASAEYLASVLEPADAPLAYWPPTYGRTPLAFDPAVDGDAKKNQMIGNEPKSAVRYRGEVMLLYPAEVARAFIRYSQATGERKYLDLAVKIAETYVRVRRPDGSWPLKLRLATGEVVGENELASVTPLRMFEELFVATGDARWRDAADRAFVWIEAHPLTDWNWDGQFEDIAPCKPYKNPTKHNAIDTMIYILERFPSDPRRIRQARDLLRFCEDRFVCWKVPANQPLWKAPSALEQYSCFCPIDSSSAKMISGYLALYRVTKEPVLLAKARALGDTFTRMQLPSGRIPTFWTGGWAEGERYDWLNCMEYGAGVLCELSKVCGEK